VAPPPSPVAEKAVASTASTGRELAHPAGRLGRVRKVTWPLVFLATGAVALAASLTYYCSRATAFYGGDCLLHLVRDLFRR